MSDITRFADGVQASWGVRPMFPFGVQIEIGDIGRLQSNGAWLPVSTTRERFQVEPTGLRTLPVDENVWDLTSGRDVHFQVYGEGETSTLFPNAPDAKVRAEIAFHSSDGFTFAATDVEITSASEISDVLQAIRHAYHKRANLPENQRWEKDLAFVFAIGKANRFTALVASEAETEVSVTGNGSAGPPQAAADFAFGVTVGISTKQLQKANRAPAERAFYRAYRLNPSIFRRWDDERLQEELQGIVQITAEQQLARLDAMELPSPEEAFVPISGDGKVEL